MKLTISRIRHYLALKQASNKIAHLSSLRAFDEIIASSSSRNDNYRQCVFTNNASSYFFLRIRFENGESRRFNELSAVSLLLINNEFGERENSSPEKLNWKNFPSLSFDASISSTHPENDEHHVA